MKTLFLTGASSGIGKALAVEYARRGYQIGILARREALLKEVKQECEALGSGQVCVYAGSATDEAFVRGALQDFVQQCGALDLVIANAGIGHPGIFLKQEWQKIQDTFEINVFAPLKLLKIAAEHFKKSDGGHFAVVSSQGAFRGAAFAASYTSSKAAVTAYFEGVRAELKSENIGISIIFPGFIDTPMTQRNKYRMPFLMKADKAAKIIANQLAKKKNYIVFPKRLKLLVGLMTKLPASLYDRLSLRFNEKDFYE